MPDTPIVLFVCPHNAAKSVFAVAELERLARDRGLAFRADSAGTEPAERPAPAVVNALQKVGIDVSGHRPRLVTREDVINADRVVTFGCDIGGFASPGTRIERWDDVPPVSHDLEGSWHAIRRHVKALVADLAHEQE